ncbi:hypothetical protein niasHT_026239 [Heterodera trifolii]|uniref:UPF3 domain-containing protein n=1 Tax=Heterodera trifolii TaxID=157864 RepID=A0ABD2JAA1_9BILA
MQLEISQMTVVKKHKEKDELTKVVLRRLPPGIVPADLNAQFAPFPAGEPHAFWFCAAPGSAHGMGCGGASNNNSGGDGTVAPAAVEDEVAATLRRVRCAFARAYLVFREEKNALSFAERFNGYVFVDRNGGTEIYYLFILIFVVYFYPIFGIESMAIVELAPNQTVPKHCIEMAKQCDERVNTFTNDVSFLKFIRRREAATAADAADGGARRVTDFDELVRQLEEKRRRLEEGQVQETPLTEFIRRMALEKARKPRRSSALKAGEIVTGGTELTMGAKEIKSRKMVATDIDKGNTSSVPKGGISRTKARKPRRSSALKAGEIVTGGTELTMGAKEIKSRKMVATDIDKGNTSSVPKGGTSRTKTRRERRRRNEKKEKDAK